jgi:hypothetical protein
LGAERSGDINHETMTGSIDFKAKHRETPWCMFQFLATNVSSESFPKDKVRSILLGDIF